MKKWPDIRNHHSIGGNARAVKLGRYAKDHPFASTQFADNIAAFDTKWYNPRPLVVQGPGAGAAAGAGAGGMRRGPQPPRGRGRSKRRRNRRERSRKEQWCFT